MKDCCATFTANEKQKIRKNTLPRIKLQCMNLDSVNFESFLVYCELGTSVIRPIQTSNQRRRECSEEGPQIFEIQVAVNLNYGVVGLGNPPYLDDGINQGQKKTWQKKVLILSLKMTGRFRESLSGMSLQSFSEAQFIFLRCKKKPRVEFIIIDSKMCMIVGHVNSEEPNFRKRRACDHLLIERVSLPFLLFRAFQRLKS